MIRSGIDSTVKHTKQNLSICVIGLRDQKRSTQKFYFPSVRKTVYIFGRLIFNFFQPL